MLRNCFPKGKGQGEAIQVSSQDDECLCMFGCPQGTQNKEKSAFTYK